LKLQKNQVQMQFILVTVFSLRTLNFAQAVIDAGLIWIGPPPAAIRALGDKVSARKIAAAAGAPLVAGTKDPVIRC
jgi:acetyl-CoA/propionyl-CoA carboxylase biotin carboxyl carrier protein